MILSFLSPETKKGIRFDIARLIARRNNIKKNLQPKHKYLHLGCGKRKIEGWLNVDIMKSDFNIDLGYGKLPWADKSFDKIVTQHVIEHLHLKNELLPLIKELYRVMAPSGVIYISTPDLEKVCNSYKLDRAKSLIEDRKTRYPNFSMQDIPSQHFINILSHQSGEHKNLFDFEMIKWMLEINGFTKCVRIIEENLLNEISEFPKRNDDYQSVYVKAIK